MDAPDYEERRRFFFLCFDSAYPQLMNKRGRAKIGGKREAKMREKKCVRGKRHEIIVMIYIFCSFALMDIFSPNKCRLHFLSFPGFVSLFFGAP